jgi:hypothetical protein
MTVILHFDVVTCCFCATDVFGQWERDCARLPLSSNALITHYRCPNFHTELDHPAASVTVICTYRSKSK